MVTSNQHPGLERQRAPGDAGARLATAAEGAGVELGDQRNRHLGHVEAGHVAEAVTLGQHHRLRQPCRLVQRLQSADRAQVLLGVGFELRSALRERQAQPGGAQRVLQRLARAHVHQHVAGGHQRRGVLGNDHADPDDHVGGRDDDLDEERGVVYFGEESRGIWKFPAEPDEAPRGELIARVGEPGEAPSGDGAAAKPKKLSPSPNSRPKTRPKRKRSSSPT